MGTRAMLSKQVGSSLEGILVTVVGDLLNPISEYKIQLAEVINRVGCARGRFLVNGGVKYRTVFQTTGSLCFVISLTGSGCVCQ